MNGEEKDAQIVVDKTNRMVDTVPQRSSDVAPLTTPPRSTFIVVFTPEEEALLKREVSRLHSY